MIFRLTLLLTFLFCKWRSKVWYHRVRYSRRVVNGWVEADRSAWDNCIEWRLLAIQYRRKLIQNAS